MDNTSIYCKLSNKNEINNRYFNTYVPIKKIRIKCSDKLSLKIQTNTLILPEDNNDKIKINRIKNIIYENKKYLCFLLNGKHNYKINDTVAIYSNGLINTFIVDKITDNCLLFLNKNIEHDIAKEYSILNMNLQNNILLNYA